MIDVATAGAYFIPMESVGIFTNFKLVTGRDGTELMFSMAPLAAFSAGKAEEYIEVVLVSQNVALPETLPRPF
jgi:hypothetical protein